MRKDECMGMVWNLEEIRKHARNAYTQSECEVMIYKLWSAAWIALRKLIHDRKKLFYVPNQENSMPRASFIITLCTQ